MSKLMENIFKFGKIGNYDKKKLYFELLSVQEVMVCEEILVVSS